MFKNLIIGAVALFGSVAVANAAPVNVALDAFIVSHVDPVSGASFPEFVDPANPAGSLMFSYDTDDVDLIDGFVDVTATSQLDLVVDGMLSTFTGFDFFFNFAYVDPSDLTSLVQLDFAIFLDPFVGPTLAGLPNATDITGPGFTTGYDVLRFSANDATGVNLELQVLAPIPLPASLPLLLAAAGGLAALRRRKA